MQHSDLTRYAEKISLTTNEPIFLFANDYCLYRAKKLKTGVIRIKQICNGIPSLVGGEEKGNKDKPNFHYKFKVESKNNETIEMLLHPKDFSSGLTFKRSIMARVPVLFSGSTADLELFISNEFDAFDFSIFNSKA